MKTLLIIDDSQSDIELLNEALIDAGVSNVRVVSATDGDDGVDSIIAFEPDLVLLDLNMPRMHGFKVLEKVSEIGIRTKVVVYSTSSDEADVRGSIDRGARAYIRKPSDYKELVELIRRTHAFWEIAK